MRNALKSIAALALAALTLAVLAVPSTALAHWSFTKWDMTPQQVVAASKGVLRADVGGEGDRVMHQRRLLSGPVEFEGRSYQAEFYFSDDDKLTLVRLDLKDQSQCPVLIEALKKRHGISSNEYHGEWADKRTGDRVFQSYSTTYSRCYTTYNKAGLSTSMY